MADEVQSIETTETPSNPVESKVEVEDLEQPKQVESEPVSAVSIPNTPAEPIAPVDTSADVQAGRQMETPPPETAQMGGDEPFLSRLLAKANLIIQGKKRKKLDKIMSLLQKQSIVTNDQVEKLLHVSDATATRYLSILEKEGRIKQIGRTGKGVSYSKI